MEELLYKEECYRIMGACFEVYKELGCGFLESVYQECLFIELEAKQFLFGHRRNFACSIKAARFGTCLFRTSSAGRRSSWKSRP